jgi:Histidine kinase-, DNA gyrase B-, and HSP90-like ATPase
MAPVTIKTEASIIDGTPDKRLFWSIISDYDLKTGLCELVDNALDLWILNNKARKLTIDVELDAERQLIAVQDDAGGVTEEDLRLLIAPGGSRNAPEAEIIGVFGVGSKRASVALGQRVEIRTRHKKQGSFELDITEEWLRATSWDLASYAIPDIKPNTTRVDISALRRSFNAADVDDLKIHLEETYSWFLDEGCVIRVNGEPIAPIVFDHWAYPPKYLPQEATFTVHVDDLGDVEVSVTAGLIQDRDPEAENYGVYFYCNHRLIVKEWKAREVGYFISGEAGVPHPDASLSRVIVQMQGPARGMPWNSSKSAINPGHPAFQQIRPTVTQLNSFFSSLSRRTKTDWDREVFRYSSGQVEPIEPAELGARKRLVLPPLPRVNKSQAEQLKSRNKSAINRQPWTLGLVEAISAIDVIQRQRFDTGNRMALILLDSNFEIALKEFIVHRSDLFPPQTYTDAHIATLFQRRDRVLNEVTSKVAIPAPHIAKARHYYLMRNKLIHERATVGITEADVLTYRATIQAVLKLLFGLKF